MQIVVVVRFIDLRRHKYELVSMHALGAVVDESFWVKADGNQLLTAPVAVTLVVLTCQPVLARLQG